MDALTDIPTVAHAIQQAIAPVFLLTGIGAVLNVLSFRLGRVIDRFRELNESSETKVDHYQDKMRCLSSRARWLHWAISLCTMSALCICLSIAALFIGAELKVHLSSTVSLLFVVAMLMLITGLLCFLREITLATGAIEKYR
jgi:hypothetical protein